MINTFFGWKLTLLFKNNAWNTFIAIRLRFRWKTRCAKGYNFSFITIEEFYFQYFSEQYRRYLQKDLSARLDFSLTVIWLKKINFIINFSHLSSKYIHMIWETWEEWIFAMEEVAYKSFSKNTRNVSVKNSNGGQEMEEEYIPCYFLKLQKEFG